MDLIESQPEFPPLEIEEQIPEPENPIRTSTMSQELVHNHSTPSRNTHQQQRIRTITQDCIYHLTETKAAPSAQKASARKYPLHSFATGKTPFWTTKRDISWNTDTY